MGKSSPTRTQKKKERRPGRTDRAIAASLAQHISSIAEANRKANARRELALLRSTAELHFLGDVTIVQSRDDAIAAARNACRPSPECTEKELVFYVDGSSFYKRGKRNARKCAGAAVVFQADDGQDWQERVFPLPSKSDASTAEMAAISEGLAVALSQTLIQPAGIRKVVIFSDSQEALGRVNKLRQHTFSEEWLRGELNSVLRKLITRSQYFGKLGISVELRWVPAHSGVEGNTRADTAARSAAADDSAGPGFTNGVYLDEALRLIELEVTGKGSGDKPVRAKRQRQRFSRYLPEGHPQRIRPPTRSTSGLSSSCADALSPEPASETPRSTKPVYYGPEEVTSYEAGENTDCLQKSCCPGGTGSDAA
jgi:ribonuclease HI